MAENSAISWTDATFNPFIGCTKVSPACDGCYAEAMMDKRYGRVEWGAPGKGVGTRVRTSEANWKKPLAWNRKAEKDGARPFVFCASLADVFDNQVPEEWRRDLFNLIRATPNLVWLLLTKRPQNIVKMAEACGGLSANAALGATCEDQERADKNVPALLDAKAELKPAFAFLSCEPLLGPIDLRNIRPSDRDEIDSLTGFDFDQGGYCERLDWIITGGETDQGGHKARPTNPDWFRSIRDQCAAAGVAYHHKQNGEWAPTIAEWDDEGLVVYLNVPKNGFPCQSLPSSAERLIWRDGDWIEQWNDKSHAGDGVARAGKNRSGRVLDGVTHDGFPAIRSMPARDAA